MKRGGEGIGGGGGRGRHICFCFNKKQNKIVTLKVESIYKRELNVTVFSINI